MSRAVCGKGVTWVAAAWGVLLCAGQEHGVLLLLIPPGRFQMIQCPLQRVLLAVLLALGPANPHAWSFMEPRTCSQELAGRDVKKLIKHQAHSTSAVGLSV